MSKITIGIDRELWKKLIQIKIDKDLKTFDDIIDYLLKNQKGSKKK